MTDDLVAFLRARLDEIEKRLEWALELGDGSEIDRHSLPGHSREVARAIHNQARNRMNPISDLQVRHLLSIGFAAGAERGEDYGARVLRGVEAKRQVLTVHRPGKEVPEWSSAVGRFTTVSCEGCGFGGPCDDPHTENINECPTLQALASEWSDHPDYRQDWTATP